MVKCGKERELNRIKVLLGLLLMVSSLVAMVFWETRGRELLLYQEVLVAKTEIKPGHQIGREMIATQALPKDFMITDPLLPGQEARIVGEVAGQLILAGTPISSRYFTQLPVAIREEESVFVIPAEWIHMRSSSLRKGDWVTLYSQDGKSLIGSFQLAFVRDQAEREVISLSGSKDAPLLERQDGSSLIHSLEIISTLAGYQKIQEAMKETTGPGLMIVQGGGTSE